MCSGGAAGSSPQSRPVPKAGAIDAAGSGDPRAGGSSLLSERGGAASGAPGDVARTVVGMRTRLCSKVGCAREAVTTLTYDYGDQMAALGPLGASGDPHAHDLCRAHTDRLSVPKGWMVVRHETLRV